MDGLAVKGLGSNKKKSNEDKKDMKKFWR